MTFSNETISGEHLNVTDEEGVSWLGCGWTGQQGGERTCDGERVVQCTVIQDTVIHNY